MRSKLFLLAFAAIGAFFVSVVNGQSYAITNAKIVTVSGATIDKGTVVIRNGLIESIAANAAVPADAQVCRCRGAYGLSGIYRRIKRVHGGTQQCFGSFASPVVIGTRVSNNSGQDTIVAVIPSGTTPGIAYRVRVVASSPSVTGSVTPTIIQVQRTDQQLFLEQIGSVGATTAIAKHEAANGFDNDAFTMTGTADIRNTSTSTGYSGSTGGANVFITNSSGRNF